jgi:hypothetical protein
MKYTFSMTALLLASVFGNASAQHVKPGLWENETKMVGGSGELASALAAAQKQMESLPPESRKMMQEMMAKQGTQLNAGKSATIAKNCVTKEMVERNELTAIPSADKHGCTQTHSPLSKKSVKFSGVCTNPVSSIEGEMTYISPEAYSIKMTTMGKIGEKTQTMDLQVTGRWLGPDCGAIKPLTVNARAN